MRLRGSPQPAVLHRLRHTVESHLHHPQAISYKAQGLVVIAGHCGPPSQEASQLTHCQRFMYHVPLWLLVPRSIVQQVAAEKDI